MESDGAKTQTTGERESGGWGGLVVWGCGGVFGGGFLLWGWWWGWGGSWHEAGEISSKAGEDEHASGVKAPRKSLNGKFFKQWGGQRANDLAGGPVHALQSGTGKERGPRSP